MGRPGSSSDGIGPAGRCYGASRCVGRPRHGYSRVGAMLSSLSLKIGVAALLVALLGISLYGMMHAKQEQARAEVKLEQAVQAHQQAQERLKAAQAIDTRQEGVRRSEGLSVRRSVTLAAQAANLKENQDAADPATAG